MTNLCTGCDPVGDALESVRQMTDAAGELTYTQSYDPYGVVTQTSGDSQTDYGYTGESYGDSTQLLYLRARYYNPGDGSFTSRDKWDGDASNPMSFNRWNYTDSNPINHTDPSRYCYIDSGNMRRWRIWEYPIGGPCENHSDDVISPDNDHYHHYATDNVVCPAYLSCSKEEVGDAMIRFDFPGQDPSQPIENDHRDSVAPFKGTPYAAFGAIRSIVSHDHLTTANVALPTHIFYAGRVDRKATRAANGDWIVSTRGTGNNIYLEMDAVNMATGALAFNIVDMQMRKYIEKHRFKDWIKNFC